MHNLPTDTTFAANTWAHVQTYLDFPNSVVSWVIDGVYKGSALLKGGDTGTVISPATANFTSLKFYVAGAGGATVYVDDLIVSQGSFMVPNKIRKFLGY
jgi:hypothetical protein